MKIDDKYNSKTDPLLQQALSNAGEREVLRAVMVIGTDSQEVEHGCAQSKAPQVDPSQFSSRLDYRKALIAQKQSQVADDMHEVLQALHDLSLSTRGGTMGKTVVVEGPASQILASLELPSVLHASLDQEVNLIEPYHADAQERDRA